MKSRIASFNEFYFKIGIVISGTLFYCFGLMSFCDMLINILAVLAIFPLFIAVFFENGHVFNKSILIVIVCSAIITILLASHRLVTIILLFYICIEVMLLPYCNPGKNERELQKELDRIAIAFEVITIIVAGLSMITYVLNWSITYYEPQLLGETMLFLGIDKSTGALVGVFANANAASVLYIIAIGLLFYLKERFGHSFLIYIIAVFFAIMLYLTDSRGGIIGLGVIFVFWVFAFFRKVIFGIGTKIMLYAFAAAVLGCGCAGAVLLGIVHKFIAGITGGIDASTASRMELWKAGIRISTSDPLSFLFGVGGNFRDLVSKNVSPIIPKVLHGNMHNIYMQTLLTFGFIGLVMLLLLIINMVLYNTKMITEKYETNKDMFPLIGIICAVATISLVEADFYMGKTFQCTIVWILAGYVNRICILRKMTIDTDG